MRGFDMFMYASKEWPNFTWQNDVVLPLLSEVKLHQGFLLGKMSRLGFQLQNEALLTVLTEDVTKSSEIEGENLDLQQVRSSIARRLGLKIENSVYADHDVEGVVEMMLDATQRYDAKVTEDRLKAWQAALFPSGFSGFYRIVIGGYRDDKKGPMQVVSGPIGSEKVHYQAPAAELISLEMRKLVEFINASQLDNILKAAVVHLWFVILHPFEDGNGRVARALTDLLLARSENSPLRFYSLSSQIKKNRNSYYDILERVERSSLDITEWQLWFLENLLTAIREANGLTDKILFKSKFWEKCRNFALSERQTKMLNKMLDGFHGNVTTKKWSIICKCSHDTANRDISDLIAKGILQKEGDGRSTHYIMQ
ncbi:cell division protein Fic [Alphaproteobacteria bacterium]|nr:cell division protein Fic [Alphaproteobacteria bacterium]